MGTQYIYHCDTNFVLIPTQVTLLDPKTRVHTPVHPLTWYVLLCARNYLLSFTLARLDSLYEKEKKNPDFKKGSVQSPVTKYFNLLQHFSRKVSKGDFSEKLLVWSISQDQILSDLDSV